MMSILTGLWTRGSSFCGSLVRNNRVVMNIITLLFMSQCVAANVEKVIFIAPPAIPFPSEHPSLDHLYLNTLTPSNSTLRTQVEATFPAEGSLRGKQTWVLLDNLIAGQRYELRVCWAATQPTEFWLVQHSLSSVFETPALITSLAEYSETRQPSASNPAPHLSHRKTARGQDPVQDASVLFLQVFAAADYFTHDETLMLSVPPAEIDLILDPYVFNVLPRSLLPTGFYILVLAIGACVLAEYTWAFLRGLGQNTEDRGIALQKKAR